ncbi:MAG TPA: TolC family protein [Noviherbaspirillum sp.]
MKTVLRACALAIALAFVAPHAALAENPAPGSTLESLLAYARERNPELASMRHEADAAREKIGSAGVLPDPKLRVELMDITKMNEQNPTLSPSRVGRTRYQIMQELPWYGKRGLQREIAEIDAEGAQARASGAWTELASRIKAAYAQFYFVSHNERLTRELLELMNRLERISQVRYAGGLSAQSDAIRAQVEQTNLRTELLMFENERRQVRSRLNMLLGRRADAPLAEPETLRAAPAPASLEFAALADRVRSRNPQLFAEESRVRSAEKNRALTYKNRYPDFAVGVTPVQIGSGVKEWEVMFEVNIPLQQGSRRAMEREAEAMLSAARSRKEATANQLLAELEENLAMLEAARRTETLMKNSLLPQAELTFQSALASYENGKVDFATLLDAQRQIREARHNLIKAQVDTQLRLADIERILGEE